MKSFLAATTTVLGGVLLSTVAGCAAESTGTTASSAPVSHPEVVKAMKARLGLNQDSFVVEVASNDGYLLQYFVNRGVPVLGIEPAANVAKVAVEKGVPTLVRFFGTKVAEQLAAKRRT